MLALGGEKVVAIIIIANFCGITLPIWIFLSEVRVNGKGAGRERGAGRGLCGLWGMEIQQGDEVREVCTAVCVWEAGSESGPPTIFSPLLSGCQVRAVISMFMLCDLCQVMVDN